MGTLRDPPGRNQQGGTSWQSAAFGRSSWAEYLWLVASLFGLRLWSEANPGDGPTIVQTDVEPPMGVQYAIVTLNYDMVLESAAEALASWFSVPPTFREATTVGATSLDWGAAPLLAKLHGSVRGGVIVAPTWSKGIAQDVLPAWQLARRVFADATQIRFLGYSLPVADAYIKYLLRAAMLDSFRLSRIDVVCLDPDNSVSSRYKELFDFSRAHFHSESVTEYLLIREHWAGSRVANSLRAHFVCLEDRHRQFLLERGQQPR